MKMADVMRALEQVPGAPVLTTNQAAELARLLNAAAPTVEPLTWSDVQPWFYESSPRLATIQRFEGLAGVVLDVWRAATTELRQELETKAQVITIYQDRASRRGGVYRRYVEALKACHQEDIKRLTVDTVPVPRKLLEALLQELEAGEPQDVQEAACAVVAVIE